MQGSRIVQVLEATPVAQPDMEPSNGVWSEHLNPEKEQVGQTHCAKVLAVANQQKAGTPWLSCLCRISAAYCSPQAVLPRSLLDATSVPSLIWRPYQVWFRHLNPAVEQVAQEGFQVSLLQSA